MAVSRMELLELIRNLEDEETDIDFLREGIRILPEALMEADVSARVGQSGESATPRVGPRTETATGTVAGTPGPAPSTCGSRS